MSARKQKNAITRRRFDLRFFMFGIFATIALSLAIFFTASSIANVLAANYSGFKAGNIMSDEVMSDYNYMDEAAIQRFLKEHGNCNNRDIAGEGVPGTRYYYSHHVKDGHYVCLSDELFPDYHVSDYTAINDGKAQSTGETAAHIIYRAAQDYKINPAVLIVLLQKEQGLITDSWPNTIQYRAATGYGCPDNAACDSEYYGFKNQVRLAASLFRYVLDGKSSMYPVGNNYVLFNPNRACGGTNVYIENRATSALYRYTPYQPNAAALNGGSDGCSAYGNRNFYGYYTDWFGDTHQRAGGEQTIKDGNYTIVSKLDNNKVVDVSGGSTANGANIQLWNSNNTGAQKFKFTYLNNGYYSIKNILSNRAVDVSGAGSSDGTNIRLWDFNNTCAQQWIVKKNSDSNYSFINRCSGKYLDVSGGGTADGTNIQIWNGNNTSSQKFILSNLDGKATDFNAPDPSPVNEPSTNKPVDNNSSNNTSNNNSNSQTNNEETTNDVSQLIKNDTYYIVSTLNQDKVIDVSGGRTENGTNIQLWDKNGTKAQKFEIKHVKDGYYTIMNTGSGKYVDVSGAGHEDKTNIQIYVGNGTCAQSWKINKNSDNTYSFINKCSNKLMDVSGGNTANSTNIQIYTGNNTKSQKFTLEKV